nr:hypothetical protein CFP56_58138 [Quercus suber]
MAISGFLFLSWRIFELITLVPIVGMLGWFVHRYTDANLLTPTYVLVLFIVSVLALAWVVFTTISYLRARHDALFVALVDLGFVGALIAGVYYLRGITGSNCITGSANLNGGIFINIRTNKDCAMLKASFALGIIDIISFFITFVSIAATLSITNQSTDPCPLSSSLYSSTTITAMTMPSSSNALPAPRTAAAPTTVLVAGTIAATMSDPATTIALAAVGEVIARRAKVAGNIMFERSSNTACTREKARRLITGMLRHL